MGELLKSCPGLDVISEPPSMSQFPALSDLSEQYLSWRDQIMADESQCWKNIDMATALRRLDEQLISFCYSLSPNVPGESMTDYDGSRQRIADVEAVCFKQPNAELDIPFHNHNIRSLRPKYLYCVRDPRKVFRSLISMPWGVGTTPEGFLEVLANSLSHIRLIPDPEERLLVVNVDYFSAHREDRLARLPELIRELGLTVDQDVLNFIAEWPSVNRTRDTWGTRTATDEEMSQFDAAYAAQPELREAVTNLMEQGKQVRLGAANSEGQSISDPKSTVVAPPKIAPSDPVTRAELAVFLLRSKHGLGYQPPALADGHKSHFVDVPVDHWAAAWIEELRAEGIAKGREDGRFDPEGVVTRDQVAVFLLRIKHGAKGGRQTWFSKTFRSGATNTSSYSPPAAGESTGFVDVPASHWAAAWIKQLAAEGITNGCGNGRYCPDMVVTRAHLATFLARIGGIL